jgi:hypothetical protein
MTDMRETNRAAAASAMWDREFITRGGVPEALPTTLPGAPKQVETLLVEYNDAQQQRAEVAQTLQALKEGEQAAAMRDLDASATALRAGKPDPGPVHFTQHEQETATATRRVATLNLLLSRIQADIRAAVVKAQASWLTDLDMTNERLTEDASKAIDALEAAMQARARIGACRDFVESAGTRMKFAPGLAFGLFDSRTLAELRQAVGS